jgi:hypothetical protein
VKAARWTPSSRSAAERGWPALSGGAAGRLPRSVAGAYERSDGYTPVRSARRGAADTPTDLQAASLSGRLTGSAGPALLSLRASLYEEERGAGLQGARSTAGGASAA